MGLQSVENLSSHSRILASTGQVRQAASPHYSPGFVASRFQGACRVGFATEERAGVVDTTSSAPTERKPRGAYSGPGAVDMLVNNAG